MARRVELFYDVVSPFSWIAFEFLTRYASKWNYTLELKPFFLGGVMQATGNQPPAMLPARGVYLQKDIKRLAQFHQLPLSFPTNFPVMTVNPQRLLVAINRSYPQHLEEVSRQFWLAYWGGPGKDISKNEVMAEVMKSAGMDQQQMEHAMKEAGTPETKQQLKDATAEAVQRGAYGAPTFYVHANGKEEMYFGSDRFHLMAMQLGEKLYHDGSATPRL